MSERSIRRAHQRRARIAGITGAAAATALLAPAAADAATFTVNEEVDSLSDASCADPVCTLRDAVAAANASAGPDTILFASALTGTITLTEGDLVVTGGAADGLTVTGPGAATLAISGDADGDGEPTFATGSDLGDSRIFRFAGTNTNDRQSVSIAGLTLRDGVSDGFSGQLLPTNGGLISSLRTDLTITDAVLSSGFSTLEGGAVYADQLDLDGTTISGNTARGNGGGLSIHSPSDDSVPSALTDSTISGNRAGIDETEGSALFPSGASFVSGGGLAFEQLGSSVITGVTFSDNVAKSTYAYTGGYTYSSGEAGGAALHRGEAGGTAEVSGLTVSGNEATRSVGGIAADGAITVADSLISGNQAGRNSGGVSLSYGATLTDSTVSGNEAAEDAGGVKLRQGAALVNSTVSGNQAGADGGGVYSDGRYGYANSIDSSTIAANTAVRGGGAFSEAFETPASPADAPLQITNTAVGDNTSPDGFNLSGAVQAGAPGAVVRASFSLFETANGVTLAGNPASSNKVGVDPKLGPLAANGATLQTHLPSPASPLVDAANSALTADQRGNGRPVDSPAVPNASGGNATDIGAVERQAGDPVGDTTPPETTLASKPPATGATAPFAFTFTSSEAGSTFQCSLDGAAFTACTSPKSFATLAAGSHTFRVRATDAAGNTDATPASHTFSVAVTPPPDTVAPATSLTKQPPKKVKSKKKKVKVSFEFTGSDAVTAASALEFECSIDGAAFKSCTSPLTFSAKKGKHTFGVRAIDAAGNVDASPATATYTVKVKKKPKKK